MFRTKAISTISKNKYEKRCYTQGNLQLEKYGEMGINEQTIG